MNLSPKILALFKTAVTAFVVFGSIFLVVYAPVFFATLMLFALALISLRVMYLFFLDGIEYSIKRKEEIKRREERLKSFESKS